MNPLPFICVICGYGFIFYLLHMKESLLKQQRALEIDLIKIVSCLAVIAIHVSARGISDPAITGITRNVSQFVNGISFFAVPSFIFLSGLALMLRYHGEPVSYASFVKKRTGSIVFPYLFWSFTYFLIYTFGGFYNFDLNNILAVIFLGMGEYHLYFVVILFQLYLLFPLLKAIIEQLGTAVGSLLVLAIHLAYSAYTPSFPYMDRIFVPYLVFFCAGMFWGRHYEELKGWTRDHGVPISCIYLIFSGLYLNLRFAPESQLAHIPQLWQLFSFSTILLLMTVASSYVYPRLKPEQSSGILTLSAATFYVYLAHPLFIAGFYELSNSLGFRNISILMPVCYGLVTVLSFWGALQYLKFKSRKKKERG